MILNDYVIVKISKKNINHFSSIYKDIKLKDIIEVNPKHLQNNSNIYIDVKCDICETIRKIKYQAYNKNLNSCKEHKIYTCDKCSHIKIKSNNLKKYGVEYYSQTDEYNNKFKKTMLDRYGVEYTLQSEILKEKVKKTNLVKYGVENIFMDNEMIRSRFKKKWGVDHPSKVKEIKEKIINTKAINNTSLSSPEIIKKIKETNNLKYGGHHMKNNSILTKLKNTNLDRYCSEYIFLIPNKRIEIENSNLKKYGVNNPIGDSQLIKEKELYDYIKSIYLGEIIQSYRDGLEIDIYLPDLRLGFEFNGLYWHSEEFKDKSYHLNKTNYFKEKNIRIIHIWEDDWTYKKDIIKSQISNWLGLTKSKIFARNCIVKEVTDGKLVRSFLNSNHIQGYVGSSLKLGLYYNSELVSLMVFDHNEGRKKMEEGSWNLSRFCNKLNTNVVGSASKLLNYFIKVYKPKKIISYADNNWSRGNIYYKLGFILIDKSEPDYKYIVEGKRVHKSRFKKSRLNTKLSESLYMRKINIYKIWDCGKIKFENYY